MTDPEPLNPYQSPVDSSGEGTTSVESTSSWLWLFFSFEGRIGRGAYWLALILLVVGFLVSTTIASSAFELRPLSTESGAHNRREGLIYLGLIAPFFWSWSAISVKRWHGRNKGAAWIFINAVPYAGGIWAFVECGLMQGTRGRNRYGKRALSPWSG